MASSALDLLFKISAKDEASSQIKQLRSTFDSEVKAIDSSGKTAFVSLGNSVGLSTSQMAGLAKALPIVGIALAAVGGAAVAAGLAIFSLAKQTAEYGSLINDASLKTGLTAETLSGLDLQLKQSGTSVEAFSRSIVFMQRYLEAAAEGGKEQIRVLKALGIEPIEGLKNTEETVRKLFLALGKLDEGQRNAIGSKILGRSFQELSVFVADTNGNFDTAIEKSREMGLVMSQEAAKSADEFGDSLDELSNRSLAAGRTIGTIVIPGIRTSIGQLNEAFTSVPDVVGGATIAVKSFIDTNIGIPLMLARVELEKLKQRFGTMGDFVQEAVAAENEPKVGGSITPGEGILRKKFELPEDEESVARKAEKVAKDASDARLLLMKTHVNKLRRLYEERNAMAKENLDKGVLDQESYTAALIASEEFLVKGLKLAIAVELQELKHQTDNLGERKARETALLEQRARLISDHERRVLEIKRTGAATSAEIDLQQRRRQEEINALYDERDIAAVERRVEKKIDSEVIGERQLATIRIAAIDRAVKLLRFELTEYELTSARQKEILHELALLEARRAIAVEEATQRIIDARQRELDAQTAVAEGQLSDTNLPGGDGGVDPNMPAGQLPPPPDISPWTTVFQTLRNVGMDAMRGLAQGIGAMVQNWVLLGNVGGQSMKKLVASTLAGVAAQAAILGVMELAYAAAGLTAWGRLQFGPPGPHLKSAAFFFAAAAAAGVLGRAVAGNSFSQGGAGGGGGDSGGGSGSFGGSTAEPKTRIIEQDRDQLKRLELVLHIEGNDAFVVRAIQKDIRGNGELRQTLALRTEM